MKNNGLTFRNRFLSFKYAFQGIKQLFKSEPNAWVHTIAGVLVLIAGYFLSLAIWEWIVVIFLIAAVFAAEAFNSAIEALGDAVTPDYNQSVKHAKDLAAGGVLIISIAAAVIGFLIFLPKIILLFS